MLHVVNKKLEIKARWIWYIMWWCVFILFQICTDAGDSKPKKTKAKRPKNSDSDASDEFVPKKKKAPAKVGHTIPDLYPNHGIFLLFYIFSLLYLGFCHPRMKRGQMKMI